MRAAVILVFLRILLAEKILERNDRRHNKTRQAAATVLTTAVLHIVLRLQTVEKLLQYKNTVL